MGLSRGRTLEESETVQNTPEPADSEDQMDSAKGKRGEKGKKGGDKNSKCKCGSGEGQDGKPPMRKPDEQIESNDNSRILDEDTDFVPNEAEDLLENQDENRPLRGQKGPEDRADCDCQEEKKKSPMMLV